ncbi:tetratricopeptide repeat-containing sulfotransferase family protein [Dyella japonica]|uniref:tetratricopeptide repeat-containing sulfotransferase family protein n=1 Tax=Dyella japonica TaxID=231455 RepID=UPI0009E3E95E|nr:tetratricopeptide repeat-containing sulfotransferase family protein [Dyella japonica]
MTIANTPLGSVSALLDALASQPQDDWLAQGRALALRSDTATALAVFDAAATRFPESAEIRLGLAGLLWQNGHSERAEQLLHEWLQSHPGDTGAAFLLASLLREQGRLFALGQVLLSAFAQGPQEVDTVIRAVEMLDDYGRPNEAFTICENAIRAGTDDPRLHAYAGMLGIQLGQFERTRAHYVRALEQTPDAIDWNIPLGLAGLQRYTDRGHDDFAFFHGLLQRPGLSEPTRRAVLFALGKAHDDLGDFASAATYFRQANTLAHAGSQWSRKLWKRSIEARLAAPANPLTLPPADDWTPVFIVGVPRSGTTLLAQRLARYPSVKVRGELGWLSFWEQRLATVSPSRQQLEEAAGQYARQLRQDDEPAHWYIDKQPLNLLRVDLAMALWPNARIIHCERDPRDTALSLWSQSFHDPAHDYAYDMSDIATVIRDCRRLAAHWRERYPTAFLSVSYEQVVEAPEQTLATVAQWLGVPDPTAQAAMLPEQTNAIATASAWQARQAVYTHAVGRWKHYLPHMPELAAINTR